MKHPIRPTPISTRHPRPRAILPAMRRKYRNPAQRLRSTVDRLPERTRRAMLQGIERNRIIVGAYTDPRSGGVCPMLAAHRNGGRTDLASFAIAWDAFTDARRPRLASRREVATLRSFLEMSLLEDTVGPESVAALANQIRAEREAARPDHGRPETQAPEIRVRRVPKIRISRRPSRRAARDIVSVAQEQLGPRE